MAEPGGWFPRILRVAVGAVRPEASAMLICMACSALPPQSEKRAIQILHPDYETVCSHLPLVMAAFALECAVFSFQPEASLRGMVEAPSFQPHQGKALPVMLHVTPCAVCLRGRTSKSALVKTRSRIEPTADLPMTFQTFKTARTRSEIVAGNTF